MTQTRKGGDKYVHETAVPASLSLVRRFLALEALFHIP